MLQNRGQLFKARLSPLNPGLNFNLLFWFMHFTSTVRFQTLENKTSIDPENICGKTCSIL